MQWDLITNIILISSILTLGLFAILGASQLITRKSFKKVDRQLLYFPIPLVLMVLTYFLFEKLWIINLRPNGSGEPSFPSTHVMIVATIFFVTMVALPKYVKSKYLRILLSVLMAVLVFLTAIGRVLANMHWPIDVVGGIIFGLIFAEIYFMLIDFSSRKKKNA